MSVVQYGDFETFLLDDGDRLFRYLVYRRLFTPKEWELKYTDQTEYDGPHYHFGFIRESIALPGGDYLLGIQEVYDELPDEEPCIDYFKLSELRLAYVPGDMKQFWADDEE